MIENQGCASWGYLADSEDEDPPVVVNQEPDWWHCPRWEFCTERFSEFIFLRVFDYQFLNRQTDDPAECDDECFGSSMTVPLQVIQRLTDDFEPIQHSCDWPDIKVTRFQQTHEKRIVIQEGGGTAQWLLLTSSRDGRRDLVRQVERVCKEFSFSFTPPQFA